MRTPYCSEMVSSSEELLDKIDDLKINLVNNIQQVYKYGRQIFKDSSRKYGNKIWDILELTAICSLYLDDIDTARSCILKIAQRFPDSNRLHALFGLVLEKRRRFPEALEVYKDILVEKPMCKFVIKRIISMSIENNETQKAIDNLNKYLQT
ncbi:hypothetical protein HZS_397 [Henneguya salminicola]|uniref:ER membrane protein complex subunit 2 n=1 Tax=Henneguya salminicola TaxID=69463 RepID=A0A6G3MFT0_HENSL|nr:hypothetical protein HZS_397 [Henneguya salminicola]